MKLKINSDLASLFIKKEYAVPNYNKTYDFDLPIGFTYDNCDVAFWCFRCNDTVQFQPSWKSYSGKYFDISILPTNKLKFAVPDILWGIGKLTVFFYKEN